MRNVKCVVLAAVTMLLGGCLVGCIVESAVEMAIYDSIIGQVNAFVADLFANLPA